MNQLQIVYSAVITGLIPNMNILASTIQFWHSLSFSPKTISNTCQHMLAGIMFAPDHLISACITF